MPTLRPAARGRRKAGLLALASLAPLCPLAAEAFRPPAVPLIAHDPYFSIWSQADHLTGTDSTHWTGKPHRIEGRLLLNGRTFRILGGAPDSAPALPQTAVEVLPTRTLCTFEGEGIRLTLTFTTPALPEDIDLLSRPLTYLTSTLQSTNGQTHRVALEFDACGEIAVNDGHQTVTGQLESIPTPAGPLLGARLGAESQAVLAKRGDDIRIDWGYFHLAAPADQARLFFRLPGQPEAAGPFHGVPATQSHACLRFHPFEVGTEPVTRTWMAAYDDLFSIQFMKKNLPPYWRRNGWEAADLLRAAHTEGPELLRRCAAFDDELMADLTRAGGANYAQICALAYRQCFAAGKFVADAKGQPISFCKENHSNGCIATSDVFYPMAPQFLLFGPSVAKSFLVPFLEYASSERWKFPFAPHDLGTYPHANGQVYGGGERSEENQMPVEECGNLLILMAAVARMDGNADFAARYWPKLEQWAGYLREKGFDPENQLCTDDFAGHLAHNVNLSAKAICGIASFGLLCEMRGDSTKAAAYQSLARDFAKRWITESDDDGKSRLAFDKPGTWSQKYNLMWDRILGLGLFPDEVLEREMAFYRQTQNRYGLPLDNRREYTKLDWILWTATLTQKREDFEALVDPVHRFLHETPDRSPMTDWYETRSGRKVGFTARPVVGGVFAQMLYDKETWGKWASRDKTRAAGWAPMPVPPLVTVIVPAADTAPAEWRHTTRRPAEGWQGPDFDDSAWPVGRSGFGTHGTPGAVIGTVWDTRNIWLRREFTLREIPTGNLELWIKHDEDAVVYLNGVQAVSLSGYADSYESAPLAREALASLRPGRNTLAIHCRQTIHGQYIDAGLVIITPAGEP